METFSVGSVLGTAARIAPRVALRHAAPIAVVMAPAVAIAVAAPRWSPLVLLLDVPLAAIVTAGTVGALIDERPPPVRASVAAGLRRTPAALAVSVLVYLVVFAIAMGTLVPLRGAIELERREALPMLLVLGFAASLMLLYARWFVVLPAAVTERVGPIRALTRSGELTAGRRVELGAIVCFLGALWLGVTLVADRLIGDDDRARAAAAMALWVGFAVVRASISASAYAMIRRDAEAASPDELRRIFG